MVMAVTTMALLAYLAMEVMYDSTVEYTVNAQSLNRLKAYYAAKSGLEVGLLRVKIYQTVMNQMGSNPAAGGIAEYVDEIWRFPFAWPLVMPTELNAVETQMAKDAVQDTFMDASYSISIQDEGSKIDLNDLVSPSKTLQDITRQRLIDILERQVEDNEEWRRQYGNVNIPNLVDRIADWMSDKNSSRAGGDKRSGYDDLNRDSPNTFPPNRGFRTLQELRLVTEMNDDFFNLLAPQVTIYGMRGVNPNVASKDVLMSLDRGITSEVANELISRRGDPQLGGPYKSPDDFWGYAEGRGARFVNPNYKQIPLYFDALTTFRIKATGEFGGAVREIEVITTDLERIAARIKEFVDRDDQANNPSDPDAPAPTSPRPQAGNNSRNQLPKGPPRIVYWTER